MIGPQGPSLTAAPTGSRLTIIIGAVQSGATDSEDAMRKHLDIDEEPVRDDHDAGEDDAAATGGLPNRLLTAFEVAGFTRQTFSTGSSAAHQPACRKPTAEEPPMKEE